MSKFDVKITPKNALNSAGFDAELDGEIGGGSEPAEYLKRASVAGNTLTIIKKDGTEVSFTPETGSETKLEAVHAFDEEDLIPSEVGVELKKNPDMPIYGPHNIEGDEETEDWSDKIFYPLKHMELENPDEEDPWILPQSYYHVDVVQYGVIRILFFSIVYDGEDEYSLDDYYSNSVVTEALTLKALTVFDGVNISAANAKLMQANPELCIYGPDEINIDGTIYQLDGTIFYPMAHINPTVNLIPTEYYAIVWDPLVTPVKIKMVTLKLSQTGGGPQGPTYSVTASKASVIYDASSTVTMQSWTLGQQGWPIAQNGITISEGIAERNSNGFVRIYIEFSTSGVAQDEFIGSIDDNTPCAPTMPLTARAINSSGDEYKILINLDGEYWKIYASEALEDDSYTLMLDYKAYTD